MTDETIAFEIIDEAVITPAQDAEIKALLLKAFAAEVETFSKSRHWHGSAPLYSVIARRGGQVIGNCGVVVRDIRCGKTPARVAGIQNLGVRPDARGHNLGGLLLGRGMDEAKRRGIPFGLLFCVPELERFYNSNGWRTIDVAVLMQYEGRTQPIPGKNIAMVIELAGRPFPTGDLDLCGADW